MSHKGLDLKPCWLSQKMSFLIKRYMILLWTICSRTLHENELRETGVCCLFRIKVLCVLLTGYFTLIVLWLSAFCVSSSRCHSVGLQSVIVAFRRVSLVQSSTKHDLRMGK